MGRALAMLCALLVVGCSGSGRSTATTAPPSATSNEQPTLTVSPAATPSPSFSPRTLPFPQIPLIAATSAGEVQTFRAAKWEVETKICASTAVESLDVAANGRTVVVRCASRPAGAADPDAREAFTYDLVTKEKRAISGASTIGLGPISPDGRQLVMATPGDCPMPAPVCQTKRILLDLATGSKRELLPSDYWLSLEMRWTALGLTYFLPQCADAGCPGPQKAGTYLWNGTVWSKFSSDRLVATNGSDHHVFERRESLNDRTPLVSVTERNGAAERILSSGGGQELGLALLSDGRVVTWRPDNPGAFDGEIVVYRDGQQIRRTRGHFSWYIFGSTAGWIVVGELSGAPSWKIYAYSPDQDAFATQVPAFPLTRLAVLPAP